MIDPTGMFDDPKYAALALAKRSQFIEAEPFPHIALANFMDEAVVSSLSKNMPLPGKGKGWVPCDKEETKKTYIQYHSIISGGYL